MVTSLPGTTVARLSCAPLTYAEVGATLDPSMPAGYRHLTHTRAVRGHSYEEAAALLTSWQLHERSGLRVAAGDMVVTDGGIVVLGFGVGPLRVPIPCRVVRVVDEPDRTGFAYGTLPGHPETGEELFLVERQSDGSALLTVRAFSRPATLLTRATAPGARGVQDWMTHRYLRALDG